MSAVAVAPRQQGVVLLSVLLVLALLSALAWKMVGRHTLVIAQSQFTFTSAQATSYALGAEAFARQILYQEWLEGGAEQDTLQEVWAQPSMPFDVNEEGQGAAGYLEIQVRDLNRCFNLNSLAGSEADEHLERLRTLLRNHALPENIADAWKDWVDADQELSPFGAEDGDYLLEEIPHRTANAPAAHVSEFRVIRALQEAEITPEQQAALEESLCVLPTSALRINVNTAGAAVLAALVPDLDETRMQAFTASERAYTDVSEVTAEFPELAVAVDLLGVTSEYFEVQVRARLSGGQVEMTSLLRRDPTTGALDLIHRDFGRNFRSLVAAESERSSS